MWHNMSQGIHDEFLYQQLSTLSPSAIKIIWDVGAHIGYHSFGFASFMGAEGKVLAFEPNPWNQERFQEHLRANSSLASRIELKTYALSDKNGQTEFHISTRVDHGNSSGSYLNSITPPLGEIHYKDFRKVPVETRRGDTLVENNGSFPPDVIKIDVEGAELLALEGCRHILKHHTPLLFIEIHNTLMMFYVLRLLHDLRYEATILDESHASASRCFMMAYHPEE